MEELKPRLFLIDGSGYIFRAFYAVKELTTSEGLPVNAVYGFANMLNKVLRDSNPEYVAVAFDSREKTFRHELYDNYKANRPPPPEALVPQFDLIHELVEAHNLPMLITPGFEADDIIATLAERGQKAGLNVVIVSSDKDLMQLVNEERQIFDDRKDIRYTPERVKEKLGVPPELVGDYLALTGDASDNIPGVAGIGPKTAVALLSEFGSLDGIYANIDTIKSTSQREKLIANKEKAYLSRKLVALNYETPGLPPLEGLAIKPPDTVKLIELYKRLEFNSLLKEFGEVSDTVVSNAAINYKAYRTILTEESLNGLIAELEKASFIAVDTETTGTNPHQAELVGISVAWGKNKAAYIPLTHHYLGAPKQLELKLTLRKLAPILGGGGKLLVGQNIKYDYIILKRFGLELGNIGGDTMIAAQMTQPESESYSLSALAMRYLNHKMIEYSDVAGKGKNQTSFDMVPVDKASEYSAEDADVTWRLADMFAEALAKTGVTDAYQEIEIPLIKILAAMELAGIELDVGFLSDMAKLISEEQQRLEAEIWKLAGEKFNIASPKQLGDILFSKLGLPVIRKTKSGPSTDQAVLETLKMNHDSVIADRLLAYRSLSKLLSTYIEALPKMVNKKTGRIHTSFHQASTATGRLSSSDPNLQNIPIRSSLGGEIRKAFVAATGNLLYSFDYSQIELRVLAHFSGDESLRRSFIEDKDIHAQTASEIFGVAQSEVDKEMRAAAKAINFGLIYGKQAFGLSQELNISRKKAQEYIDLYFSRFNRIKEFQEEVLEGARKTGEVRTLSGRFRKIANITSDNQNFRQAAERMAFNTLIQGSAADIIKMAMIKIENEIRKEGLKARMLLQVHDELVFEAPSKEEEALVGIVTNGMANVFKLEVPLKVSWNKGKNWAEAH